jgi:hypothetical protein
MTGMHMDIGFIRCDELRRVCDDEQVLGILLLGCLGEVERPGDDRGAVNHHDLCMSDRVLIINERLDAGVIGV